MNDEKMKKFLRKMKINACFQSIKACTAVASRYMAGEYEVNDIEELITDLDSVEEDIDEINELILEIEDEYEKEIEELKYE